jgi:endonuclease/exonuclease/phosphatase family metal-dependent hydrolase
LNGTTYAGGAYGPTPPVGWSLVVVGDFNGDGRPDEVLYNATTRQTAIWYLNGPSGVTYAGGAYGPTLPAGWSLVAVGDFNGDGQLDYVLFNSSTRQSAIWYLNGVTYTSGAYGPTAPAGWVLRGVADFNANGKPDYVLFNSSTRQTAIWYLNGVTYAGGVFGPTLTPGFDLVSP